MARHLASGSSPLRIPGKVQISRLKLRVRRGGANRARRPKITAKNFVAVCLVLVHPPIAHVAPSVTDGAVGGNLVLRNIGDVAIRFRAAGSAVGAPTAAT